MDTYQYAMAVLAAVLAIVAAVIHAPQTGSSGSSSGGDIQPQPEVEQADTRLHVRDVYNCPTPGDVDATAHWQVYNTSGLPLTLYVSDEEGNAYQVLERIGSPAERAWTPKLEDGSYHLTCVFHSDSAVKSEGFTVADSPFTGAPKMAPITDREVSAVSITQAAAQKKRLPELQTQAHALADAIRSGDRSAAQRAYLTYLETYRSFDDASEMWPGEGLDGYAEVERMLFSGRALSAEPADALAAAVDQTAHALETEHFAIPAPDYGLRAHEVMEEFERFDLRGERDYGAHALSAALRGSVRATRETLDPLRELVESRGLDTAPIYDQLDVLDGLAGDLDGKYDTAFDQWPQEDRLRLQAEVAKANELLAPVATMTVIRRMD